jgi:predicted KAP-like P-loop ATPase
MKHLFPTTEWAFGGPTYATEFGQQWYRDLRICSSNVFDRYFRLAVSEDELPQAIVQELLHARGSHEELRRELDTLNSRGLLSKALNELAVYQDELEQKNVKSYITAIFDVTDALTEEKRGIFEVPVHWPSGSKSA